MANDADSMFRAGDLVVGSSDPGKSVYSSDGRRIVDDGVHLFGDEQEIARQQKALADIAKMHGGKPLGVPVAVPAKGKGKQAKKKMETTTRRINLDDPNSQPLQFTKTPEPVLTTVQFENEFGRIKAKVEHIVEHEQAFMLVFSNDDSVVFEPKVGETIVLYTNGRDQHVVYYPGVTFDWPSSSKKLMILFKVPQEDQE